MTLEDEVAPLRARVAQLEQGWQPIATAPEVCEVDLSVVYQHGGRRRVTSCRRQAGAWIRRYDYGLWSPIGGQPTHWMPIPAEPAALSASRRPRRAHRMARSIRSYQREISKLKDAIHQMQWVQPSYNGADSCSGCGAMRYHGCEKDCLAANVTGDFGRAEPE